MRITSSSEYAMRIMVRLARASVLHTLTAKELSEGENIPRDYVDQILMRLRRAGLVTSHRGAGGGYGLASDPSKVFVADSILAVEGQIFEDVCEKYSGGNSACGHQGGCSIGSVWSKLGLLVEDYLKKVPLSQLLGPEPKLAPMLVSNKTNS